MNMEARALFGRFVWRGVNIDDVTIHPSRDSRINPILKQDSTTGEFRFIDQCYIFVEGNCFIAFFVTHGSSVHPVFLDASKAFDRVLQMKLFEKLIQRKVPMRFVRLLKHWYKEQTMQIKWGKHFS